MPTHIYCIYQHTYICRHIYALSCIHVYFFVYRERYRQVHTHISTLAQSAGAAEYIDCISAEGHDFPTASPGYDSKQSDMKSVGHLLRFGTSA